MPADDIHKSTGGKLPPARGKRQSFLHRIPPEKRRIQAQNRRLSTNPQPLLLIRRIHPYKIKKDINNGAGKLSTGSRRTPTLLAAQKSTPTPIERCGKSTCIPRLGYVIMKEYPSFGY
jgi:hypothetical protein